jgi:hypothetical protein
VSSVELGDLGTLYAAGRRSLQLLEIHARARQDGAELGLAVRYPSELHESLAGRAERAAAAHAE